MAEFRSIHSKIWDDEWFSSLDYDGKVFFIYLITNRRASVAGIYRLPERVASAESGIPLDRIRELYNQFSEDGKVFTEKDIVWVAKLRKYQDTGSDTVAKRIKKDIDEIPDCELKRRYLAYYIPSPYPTDTVSIPYPQNVHDTDTDTDTDTDSPSPDCHKLIALLQQVKPGGNLTELDCFKAIARIYSEAHVIGAINKLASRSKYNQITPNYVRGMLERASKEGTLGEFLPLTVVEPASQDPPPDLYDVKYKKLWDAFEQEKKANGKSA